MRVSFIAVCVLSCMVLCALSSGDGGKYKKEKKAMGVFSANIAMDSEKVRIISEANHSINREMLEKQAIDEKSGTNVTSKIQF